MRGGGPHSLGKLRPEPAGYYLPLRRCKSLLLAQSGHRTHAADVSPTLGKSPLLTDADRRFYRLIDALKRITTWILQILKMQRVLCRDCNAANPTLERLLFAQVANLRR